jgi:hypothetical protein
LEAKAMSAKWLMTPLACVAVGFFSAAQAQTETEFVPTTMAREACAELSADNYQACCIAENRAEILSAEAQAFCDMSGEEQSRRISAMPKRVREVETPPAAAAPPPTADVPSPPADRPGGETGHVSHSGLGDGTNPGQGSANNNAGNTPGGQGIDNPGCSGENGLGNGNGQGNGNGSGSASGQNNHPN